MNETEKMLNLLKVDNDETYDNEVHVIEITPIGIMGCHKSYDSIAKDMSTAKEVSYIEDGLPDSLQHNVCVRTDTGTYYCATKQI